MVARDEVAYGIYLERGQPVEVLIRWGPGDGPRNVLIRRQTGELVVRPFRGLRRAPQRSLQRPAGPAAYSQGKEMGHRDE